MEFLAVGIVAQSFEFVHTTVKLAPARGPEFGFLFSSISFSLYIPLSHNFLWFCMVDYLVPNGELEF